jgi:[acyl-carrier-protein] S-malonyltransferase
VRARNPKYRRGWATVEGVLALLFPGQGAQTPGDRAEVELLAPDLLSRAIELMGADPFELSAQSTRYAQPALFVTSLARLRRADISDRVGAMAGHSLGELTALTAAGVLSIEDGLDLVIERGRLMGEARAGGMVALKADIEEATEIATAFGLSVANDNSPGQVVLSGPVEQIEPTIAGAKERKVRGMRLPVTGAFHSPLMADAADAFRAVLAEVEFREVETPVYCCATAQPFTDPRTQLADALTSPVRWREVLLALERDGFENFSDVGPSKVLDGLVRRTLPNANRVDVVSDVLA